MHRSPAVSVQAQPSGRAATEQDFSQRSALGVVARRAVRCRPGGNGWMTLPETPIKIEIGASLFLTLHKAATRQVDTAIDALQAGDYDVALTLAGAAEGMIARTGHHMFGWLKQHPRALERFDQ